MLQLFARFGGLVLLCALPVCEMEYVRNAPAGVPWIFNGDAKIEFILKISHWH